MELDVSKEMTSEEKLLQLIRKKDGGRAKKQKLPSSNPSSVSANGVNLWRYFNRFLGLICLILIGWLIYRQTMTTVPEEANEGTGRLRPTDAAVALPSTVVPVQGQSFAEYEHVFERRDIFRQPWEHDVIVPMDVSREKIDLSTQVRVAGILLDDQPQAIIEDVQAKQTMFLSVGDEVAGAVIKDIQADKVIFTVGDDEVVLMP